MKRILLTCLGFIGGAVGGWMTAILGYILYFEFSNAVDRDGGTAMAVAFALGPMLGIVTGVVAAILAYRAAKPKG